MSRHLEPVPEPDEVPPDPFDRFDRFGDEELPPRPAWWRWVAIVVAVALVVATPFAYALFVILH